VHDSLSQQLRSLSDRYQTLVQHQAASFTHDSEVPRLRNELSTSQSEVAVLAGKLAAAQQTCRSAAGQPHSVCSNGHSVITGDIVPSCSTNFVCFCIFHLYKLRQRETLPGFVRLLAFDQGILGSWVEITSTPNEYQAFFLLFMPNCAPSCGEQPLVGPQNGMCLSNMCITVPRAEITRSPFLW